MTEWRPIETAPEEVGVLVWCKRTQYPDMAMRFSDIWVSGQGHDIPLEPTHWMPLPPAPTDNP